MEREQDPAAAPSRAYDNHHHSFGKLIDDTDADGELIR